jgi:hypothetical protein
MKRETRQKGPAFVFIKESYLQGHTFEECGNAILSDLNQLVGKYSWLKTPEERRLMVLRALVEVGSQLLNTASRELRESVGERRRRQDKGPGDIDLAPIPDQKLVARGKT